MKLLFTFSFLCLSFYIHAQTDCVNVAAEATGVTCLGSDDGFIDITVTEGTPPYSFLWNTGATTEDLNDVPAGDYAVEVTDSTGCVTYFPSYFLLDFLGAIPDGVGVSYQFPLLVDQFEADQVLDSTDVLEICIIIEHSWMRDLEISVQCPDGTSIILHDHPGNFGGENYLGIPVDGDSIPSPGEGWQYCWTANSINGTWIEFANLLGTPQTLPAQNYTPFESFDSLVGCMLNGEWKMIITDLWGGDNGFVFDWSIIINGESTLERINILGAEVDCENWGISGNIFYDFNQNQVQDSFEQGIANSLLFFEPTEQFAVSNQDGHYLQLCDSGIVYTVSIFDNSDWILSTDSSSYTILFEPHNLINFNNDFGLIPAFERHDGVINLSSANHRCNTSSFFYLRFENTGTYLETGQIKLYYDSTSTFELANPEPDLIDEDNHLLIWNYDTLYPFQYEDIYVVLEMPDENSTGESIHFLAEMYRDSLGESFLLDEYFYSFVVECSFDPNDKQVNPPGVREENYTLHDEKLTYTVRFQNTGNAAAIDIRILDTLDTNLDINTFRVLNSSFPVQTSIQNRTVEFYFKDIWLPDSDSNEAASHGFVTYEISPIEGLDDYIEIQNTAHIIFDFNPAIITNTTRNTMIAEIPTGINELEKVPVFIHPNPASNHFYISINGENVIDNILIYNQLGQVVLKAKEPIVDVSTLTAGVYMVRVEVEGKVGVGKLIIEK